MKNQNLTSKVLIFACILFVFALSLPVFANAQYYGCSSYYQQKCYNNNLYWFDSCGNPTSISQYCPNGCNNNETSCRNYYNNYDYNYGNNYGYNYSYYGYGNCTYHAYRECSQNNVYWYNSCGVRQELYTTCNNGLTCQYGQCVNYVQPTYNYGTYNPYFRTACYNNSVHWFDSLGAESGLYKACADQNSCTQDACSTAKCSNTLKCDGTTCATNSADFNLYCKNQNPVVQNSCGNGTCESNLNENTSSCPTDCKTDTINNLSLSLLAKTDPNSNESQKNVKMGSEGQAYFTILVTNNSTTAAESVNVLVNIPQQVSVLGNLKLNDILIAGDISTGINVGSIAPSTTKIVTFEGKTQTLSEFGEKQATATIVVSGRNKSDSITINFEQNEQAAAVSDAPATSNINKILKHWYFWVLGGIAMVFLFIAVFKRLSSQN